VDALHTAFLSKTKNKTKTPPKVKEVVNEAGDSASDFSEDEEEESDVEMGDAPAAVPQIKERLEPVIDDDGFELVQNKGRKKR
jgi:pre-rRNA-processing protein TSR2